MSRPEKTAQPDVEEEPRLMILLGVVAIVGTIAFFVAIVIGDIVVPDHDWIADTISDLGAGEMEYIVDIGIYSYSAALICCALLAAHVHFGGLRWSYGIVGLAFAALVVFLIGARNEYGDNDNEGVVIHIYLVYALGFFFATIPAAMADGIAREGKLYGRIFWGVTVVWIISAPIFFMLPTGYDGIYERYLGLITFVFVITLALVYIRRGRFKL